MILQQRTSDSWSAACCQFLSLTILENVFCQWRCDSILSLPRTNCHAAVKSALTRQSLALLNEKSNKTVSKSLLLIVSCSRSQIEKFVSTTWADIRRTATSRLIRRHFYMEMSKSPAIGGDLKIMSSWSCVNIIWMAFPAKTMLLEH